jgi:hypothetical protein
MPVIPGEQAIATILKHDKKTTSYKFALLRSINDLVLMYPDVAGQGQDVAVPLNRLAELWVAYYWPFADEQQPIAQRGHTAGNDMAFRPSLALLRSEWQQAVQLNSQPADGFFLLTEMRTPRRRSTYSSSLQRTYDRTVIEIAKAIHQPIQFAGVGEWSIFKKPTAHANQVTSSIAIPGTQPHEQCVVVPAVLWEAFHRLSVYIEALCIHEWCLFTEGLSQNSLRLITRGHVYNLLTARPDNRQPLSWERNQVNLLLHEQGGILCVWTGRRLTRPDEYDLDHLLPLKIYPINELWNLLPVDTDYNQHTKRDRVPKSEKLLAAQPLVAAAYTAYNLSAKLRSAVQEDAALRFTNLATGSQFAASLAERALSFIDSVATARFAARF